MLSDYLPLYHQVAAGLAEKKWFRRGWKITAGPYPPDAEKPKSIGIQLYRDTWFNDSGRGIHFESWMTNADVARGTASVVLHIESRKERTGINGKKLVQALLQSAQDRIRSWEGYEIKPNYTMQPFGRRLAVTPENLAPLLQAELGKLAEQLGDEIDRAILLARK